MTYIVWTDYGSEGWQGEYFDSEKEVIASIRAPGYGQRIITKAVDLKLVEELQEE